MSPKRQQWPWRQAMVRVKLRSESLIGGVRASNGWREEFCRRLGLRVVASLTCLGHPKVNEARRQLRRPPPYEGLADMIRSVSLMAGVPGAFRSLGAPARCPPSFRRCRLSPWIARTRHYSVASPSPDQALEDIDLSLAPARGSGASCRGRRVLLTGGTSGIGLGIAERLVEAGAGRVLILTRDLERGAQTIAHLKSITGHEDAPVSALSVDISNPVEVKGSVAQAIKKMVSYPCEIQGTV